MARVKETERAPKEDVLVEDETPPSYDDAQDTPKEGKKVFYKEEKKGFPVLPVLLIGLIVAGYLIYSLLFKVSKSVVSVKQVHWERRFEIEEYREVEERGWSVPDGARVISSWEEVFEYVEDIVGYKEVCKTVESHSGGSSSEDDFGEGGGSSSSYSSSGSSHASAHASGQNSHSVSTSCRQEPITESRPVYATKYKYLIWRWIRDTPVKKEGNAQHPVEWPVYQEDSHHRIVDKVQVFQAFLVERETQQEHTYTVDMAQYDYLTRHIGKTCNVQWSYMSLKSIDCSRSRR